MHQYLWQRLNGPQCLKFYRKDLLAPLRSPGGWPHVLCCSSTVHSGLSQHRLSSAQFSFSRPLMFTPHPSHQPAPQKGSSAAAQSQAQALGSYSHPVSAGGARAEETEEGVHACIKDRGPREQWSHNTIPHTPGLSIFIDCSFRKAQARPPETVLCNVYPRQEADSASPEDPS